MLRVTQCRKDVQAVLRYWWLDTCQLFGQRNATMQCWTAGYNLSSTLSGASSSIARAQTVRLNSRFCSTSQTVLFAHFAQTVLLRLRCLISEPVDKLCARVERLISKPLFNRALMRADRFPGLSYGSQLIKATPACSPCVVFIRRFYSVIEL
jgi:hypothetical protein